MSNLKRTVGLCLAVSVSLVGSALTAQLEVVAETAKLAANDGQPRDALGNAVSLDGDRLVVGAYSDRNETNEGSAYVFERSAEGSWSQKAKLIALDGEFEDEFAFSVSLWGNRLAVGAPGNNANGNDSGSVYIFDRDTEGNWVQTAKLLALLGEPDERFGDSVSLQGDRVAIGAPERSVHGTEAGSAYIFERDIDGNWLQAAKLLPLDGQFTDQFGGAISLDGNRVASGAYQNDANGLDSGAVYIFERDEVGSWHQAAKLLPLDIQVQGYFGLSVSLRHDRVAISANGDNENGSSAGAAYVFERGVDENWVQIAKLLPLDGQSGDLFGHSVSLGDNRVAIGVLRDDDNGNGSGSAYIFDRDVEGNWLQVEKLLPLDGETGDNFGMSASVDGDRVAVGAWLDDVNGTNDGSAYVFEPVVVAPRMMIAGTCPGEVELETAGVTPRQRVRLYRAQAIGQHTFEAGPCAGTQLDLDTPLLLRGWNTDFDGEGSLVRTVEVDQCGDFLQLVDERTCLVSDVVRIPPAP